MSLGITIRLGATKNEIVTAGGSFDLSRKRGEKLTDYNRRRNQHSSKLIGDLSKLDYFKKVEEK